MPRRMGIVGIDGRTVYRDMTVEEEAAYDADRAWTEAVDAARPPAPQPRDFLAELDALKARNAKLEAALAAKALVTKAEIDAAVITE